MNQPDPLGAVRERIDAIDTQLVALLNERAAASREVGRIKRNLPSAGQGNPVLKPFREQTLANRLLEQSAQHGVLPDAHLLSIYREILSSSRALQRPERVAFLGPEGTFSHYATTFFLGGQADACAVPNLAGVFRAVAENSCDFGMAPLENSLHGAVGETLDLFLRHDARIVSELYLRVRHCLISTEKSIDDVRTVFSHPQALGQCSDWLKSHLPGARLIPVESTAAGVVRVASEMGGAAAIGHAALARRAGQRILANSIENDTRNWTRFVLIANGPLEPVRPPFKTSVLFTVPDAPGTLSAVLEVLAKTGVNMSKLESRPLPGQTWKYAFFADMRFTGDGPDSEEVLNAMSERCLTLRVLGEYPEGRIVDAGRDETADDETSPAGVE